MRNFKPILLVEDDDLDALTIQRAIDQLGAAHPLVRVKNGEEALEYLMDATARKPCLVLLDLNMPRMNGIEFLAAAKADDRSRRIPVVVLTTSQEPRDVNTSFDLGVAGYIVKPLDYEEFLDFIRIINQYWTLSELPVVS